MHYYQFNIGDYRKDTTHLSRAEHGIYRDLIDWYYLEETPIPKETQTVSRRLRLNTQEDIDALENVLADFFTDEADGYHHARIDQDIDNYHANANKNRVNGKKGGRPKGKKTQSVSSGLPDETQTKAKETLTNNHKPITKNQLPHTPTGVDVLFDTFWQAYPKRIGKDAAKRAFVKRKPDKHLTDTILRAVAQQKESAAWQKDGGQYIPNPATWINQGRWLDEIDTQQSNTFLGAI